MASSTLLSTILGLSATFLVLALLVQVVQEIYKHLTSSKSTCYKKVLRDFLGPWALKIIDSPVSSSYAVRGPFQWIRILPRGKLRPLDRGELVNALEHTTPDWYQRTLQALRLEADLQRKDGTREPSPNWHSFLSALGRVGEDWPTFGTARDVARFLSEWGHEAADPKGSEGSPQTSLRTDRFDASQVLLAFRETVTPHVTRAEREYEQLQRNFSYAYRRRNLRQTFLFGLALAILANVPADLVYQRAAAMTPDQAVALAERTSRLYEEAGCRREEVVCPDLTRPDSALAFANRALMAASEDEGVIYFGNLDFYRAQLAKGWLANLRYLFYSVVTALLISFGAPFWNDITKAILRVQRARKPVMETE